MANSRFATVITQEEYQDLVKRAYEGKILVGVDRALAREWGRP